MRLEAMLGNGMRLIITHKSDSRNIQLFNEASKEEIEFKQM